MARDGEWSGAEVLHALACAYGVDVCILQGGQHPVPVGIPLTASSSRSVGGGA